MVRNWGDSQGAPGFFTVHPKALVRSRKAAYRPIFCPLHVSCICLSAKIMSAVPLLDLNPRWLFCVFFCAIVGMSLFSRKRAKILPATESRGMPM